MNAFAIILYIIAVWLNFGCKYCATGDIGLKRNLTSDEITDQILYFHLQGHSINSISFMGMGEALVLAPKGFFMIRYLKNNNSPVKQHLRQSWIDQMTAVTAYIILIRFSFD